MLGPMNPAHMIRLGPSTSPRLAGVSAADASLETIDLAGALPFRIMNGWQAVMVQRLRPA